MKRNSFTLLELLVVIAIIGILASLLLPALAKSKYRAKMTMHANNMHQMAIAFINYSSDYDGMMPTYFTGDQTDRYQTTQSGYSQYDWVTMLKTYGAVEASENVITRAPQWDDAGNTKTPFLQSTWIYQVGSGFLTNPERTSSQKVSQAGEASVLLSDWMRQTPGGVYYGVHSKNFGGTYSKPDNNPSRAIYVGMVPLGSYSGMFDGSVHWVRKGDMDFYSANGGYKHWFVPNE